MQEHFQPIFGAEDVKADGGDFDRLLKDGERLEVGGLTIEVIHTPGHTPACVGYKIADAVFVGDTLFMPDFGTARTDFPAAARVSFTGRSASCCHCRRRPGYSCATITRPPAVTRSPENRRSRKSVAIAKHVHDGVGEEAFVAMRQERDKGLSTPRLLIPSIRVNMRGGRFPPAEASGVRYLRIRSNSATASPPPTSASTAVALTARLLHFRHR